MEICVPAQLKAGRCGRTEIKAPEIIANRPPVRNIRHNLFLAFKEALDNIVTNAAAGSGKISSGRSLNAPSTNFQ